MSMLKKNFNYFSMFATGIFFCVIGFSFLFDSLAIWNWLYITFVIGISSLGIMKVFNILLNYRKVKHKFSQFADIVIWTIAIIISLIAPSTFYMVLPRIIGTWILFHAIVKIIVLYIRVSDKLTIHIITVIFLLGDLIMCFFLIIKPNEYEYLISCFMGVYFLIYGGNTLLDFVREITPSGSGEKLDQKIRLAVPPYLAALIPNHLMKTLLSKDKDDVVKEQYDEIKKDIPYDMEVLIHLAPSGPAMLGHADMIYRGLVLSYGCYDPHTRRLMGTMGDGVVIIAPRNSYIKNCLENENKTLISFGIYLNVAQKEKLNKRLLEVFGNFVDFESDEVLRQKGKPYVGACDDYISRVSRTSPTARFYKIKEGKLRTFFVLSSNCVYFLSNLLSVVGLNMIDLSGIVSPGSYYDFLNKQFKSNKSFVVSRKLYRKHDAHLF